MSFRFFSSLTLLASRSSLSPLSPPTHTASLLSPSFNRTLFSLIRPSALVPSSLPLSQNPIFRRGVKALPEPGTPEYWDEAKKLNPERIREKKLDLIDDEGERLGHISLYKALDLANERNCLLRPVNQDVKPIMARLFPRVKKQKKDSLKVKEKIKEIKFSHKIAEHDAQVKIKKVMKLLATRHRVKIVIFYPSRRDFDAEISHNMLDYINNQIPETAGYLDQGKYYNEFATAYCYINPVATQRELGKAREQQEVEIVQLRKKKKKTEESEEDDEEDADEQEAAPTTFRKKRLEKDEQYFRSGGRHGGVLDDRLDEDFYSRPGPRPPQAKGGAGAGNRSRQKGGVKKPSSSSPQKK